VKEGLVGYGIKDILHEKAKRLLHLETDPGLGCTEPAAVGLCAAAAAAMLGGGEIDSITVETDPNIYKNAMGVIIPHADGGCGIPLAAAMGAAAGDEKLKLQVFASVTAEGLARAKELLAAGKVAADIAKDTKGLYVKVCIVSGGDAVQAVIEGEHDNIVSRVKNGEETMEPKCDGGPAEAENGLASLQNWILEQNLADMVDILDDLDSDDLSYIRKGLALNSALVKYGLAHGPGMGVGRTQLSLLRQGLLRKDAPLWAGIRVAAGIDSRMGGAPLPAMTLAGSGNQGIAASMPVLAASEFAVMEDEAVLLRAVTLSYLVTCAIKASAGRLSALCGSGVAAGCGAAAGTCYLFGGTVEKIGGAVKNHVENTAALICDGAKTSCAIKVGEAACSAVKSAFLALSGCVVGPLDGIIDASPETTMGNVGLIARKGLASMDQTILGIMLEKRPI
jgi:L-cysteine desulfidase